ncbi:MAG: hypothetical protein IKY79_03005, partial [Bacteroidales bacterium]|nr:hypothetical protein [Bacteroidales bacterium]
MCIARYATLLIISDFSNQDIYKMKHFTIHRLSKTHTSLLPKVSDSLCCGNRDSAVFFYHSDHLGSASWITNSSGTPVQHL